MRIRLFQHIWRRTSNSQSMSSVKTDSIKGEVADFVLLGFFGAAAIRHIIKDCEQKRNEQKKQDQEDMTRVITMRENIVKASLNGCDALPTDGYRKRCD